MRKFRNLFRTIFFAGLLLFAFACSEDETMNELMETIDKYELENQSNGENKDKPPSNGGG